MATPATVRADLVYTLRDDLLGPDPDDPRDAAHATETLTSSPAHWYLTGFLAPTGQKAEEKEDEEAGDDLSSALDDASEGEADAPAARRPVFPSSMGLSVLVRAASKRLTVRVTFGTYAPASPPPSPRSGEGLGVRPDSDIPPAEDARSRHHWVRTPYEHTVTIPLDDKPRFDVLLEGSGGVVLRVVLRPVPETELAFVEKGTRYATIFLVNQRDPIPRPEEDRGFIFQTRFTVSCTEDFVPRPNLRGASPDADIDEKVGDLLYRDCFEYAVGHGVSTVAKVQGQGRDPFCNEVSTTWLPTAEIEKVEPSEVKGVTLEMRELAKIEDAETLKDKVGKLVTAYGEWIEAQADTDLDGHATRMDTAAGLLDAARRAKARIERGIRILGESPAALEAFRVANDVMADAQTQREKRKDPASVASGKFVPKWRPFQLAFLLMNVAAQVEPTSDERDWVDLIFFPTGGGKTEAYLGLAAFTLVLRRLTHPGIGSAGVTVLMRYTLRLLTLDQLERAAALICALELRRRKDPQKLGPQRFSIGLWVGKSATPNRFGTDQDHDESTALNRVKKFREDPKKNPSPIPLDRCPWCGESFHQDTFELKPDFKAPDRLRVVCTGKCEFRWQKDHPEGIPILAVDDEIYRELPCFLIATVDKFAGLPWVGKTGLLLGKNVTHHNQLGFYGPAEMPPTARPLPEPLLPPDLIIQDELHLISGPLGTMVGLYETAIDHLTTRQIGEKRVRPKIVASTATVRRAQAQIRALFGRSEVEVFPPPGPNRRTSFFAETVPTTKANARQYVGLSAPGRSQKVLLMRTYIALLSAAQRTFLEDPKAADPYMTLVGYFNSLRELGGSQRIVEEEVRARLMRASLRHRAGETSAHFVDRKIAFECVELTSRRTTDEVKEAKERLEQVHFEKSKKHAPVDVALASNMISVGVDIQRLGLMVVCGQPKTTAEYIQATSRVGRDAKRPGLVVTLLNAHKPRDRSHFEHFAAYHQSFYRGVEATSITPFSPRAVDRGIAGLVVALARLGDPRLTAPDAAEKVGDVKTELGFIGDVIANRAEAHRKGQTGDDPIDDVKAVLRARIDALLDSWTRVVKDDPTKDGLAYQKYEEQSSKRPLLRMPLDEDLAKCKDHEKVFVANRSMRDVEGTTDVYVADLRASQNALARAES
ncbi:DISARM system helicase DrmA [Polyangium spumosum]|uniref:Helicase n=1 Tax=Polyangium spumosum TaxID=889282 RepID=A0A6N7PWF8_9BACT|nr:DISARM system helicase DrmA [Polyangium spumosum]MRG96408.1 helicase [Polyangium spumosum]